VAIANYPRILAKRRRRGDNARARATVVLMLNVSFSCTKVPPFYRQSMQPKQRGMGESEGVEYKSIERKGKEGKEEKRKGKTNPNVPRIHAP
jgi:hypothetical protein